MQEGPVAAAACCCAAATTRFATLEKFTCITFPRRIILVTRNWLLFVVPVGFVDTIGRWLLTEDES